MPNRMIKDSIHTSEDVNAMTDFQFRLWISLITYVDDYGRGDARPAVIKGACFPLRERVTVKDIDAALQALAGIGCISLYSVDGKSYLYFPRWESHQRIQTKHSKFPGPDEADGNTGSRKSTVTHGDSPLSTVTHGDSRPEIEVEKEIEIETEEEKEKEIEKEKDCTEPQAPSVLSMTLNDGTEYGVTQEDIDEWSETFPNVDVTQQLRLMKLWCRDNPKKRKTRSGIRRFIYNWLEREQNRGWNSGYAPKQEPRDTPPPDATRRPKAPEWMPELADG